MGNATFQLGFVKLHVLDAEPQSVPAEQLRQISLQTISDEMVFIHETRKRFCEHSEKDGGR